MGIFIFKNLFLLYRHELNENEGVRKWTLWREKNWMKEKHRNRSKEEKPLLQSNIVHFLKQEKMYIFINWIHFLLQRYFFNCVNCMQSINANWNIENKNAFNHLYVKVTAIDTNIRWNEYFSSIVILDDYDSKHRTCLMPEWLRTRLNQTTNFVRMCRQIDASQPVKTPDLMTAFISFRGNWFKFGWRTLLSTLIHRMIVRIVCNHNRFMG